MATQKKKKSVTTKAQEKVAKKAAFKDTLSKVNKGTKLSEKRKKEKAKLLKEAAKLGSQDFKRATKKKK